MHLTQASAAASAAAAQAGSRQHARWRRPTVKAAAFGSSRQAQRKDVAVRLTSTSFSSRKLQASVDIAAPLPVVWQALTDYDNLGSFIPSLAENRCLERRRQGCLLYQVGAQDVALGIKFSAACTLEIQEYAEGIPAHMVAHRGDYGRYFPSPEMRAGAETSYSAASTPVSSFSSMDSMSSMSSMDETSSSGSGTRDISFNLVAGDFQAFKGIWRMQPAASDPAAGTVLQYALFVRPHPWLPVKLIEDRISSEVVNNLNAVRRHTERVHRQLQQQRQRQQQQQQQQQVADAAAAAAASSSTVERSSSTLSSSTTVDVASSEE